MNMKNELRVIINGKQYTLSGYESEEYLQKTANFLNTKHNELAELEGYNHLEADLKNVLMQINLADEYFKMAEEKAELERQLDEKNKEIFELKHELIAKKEEERGKKRK